VRVQSQIRVVSSSSIYLFLCISERARQRKHFNQQWHTHRQLKSFFCVCLSYIHTSYLFCTCALRVLLLLLSSLSFFFFLFSVVIRCHCRLLLCLNFFFYALFNIWNDNNTHWWCPSCNSHKTCPAQMCVSSIRSDYICLSLLASFICLFFFYFISFFFSFACVYFVCVCLLNYTNRCVAVSPLLSLNLFFFSYSTTTRRFSLSLFLWFFNCIK